MAIKSRFKRSKTIPKSSSRKFESVSADFSGGIKTYTPEQKLKPYDLLIAQDMRMEKIGKYRTRHGSTVKFDAMGRATAQEQWSDENLEEYVLSGDSTLEVPVVASGDFRLWAIQFMCRKDLDSKGVVSVRLYAQNEDGSRGDLVAHSNINYPDLSTMQTQVEVKFVNAPDIVSGGNYILQFSLQPDAAGDFYIQTSTDFGNNGALYRLISATAGGVDSIFVANNSGVFTTFFAQNGILYRTDESGETTIQNDELPTGTRKVRFNQAQYVPDDDSDPVAAVRYVGDAGGNPRVILLEDFSEIEIADPSGRNLSARNVMMFGSFLFYMSADDPNGVFTSERLPLYDKFDVEQSFVSDIPAPKCGDDLAAFVELGGTLFFLTKRNKYALYGDDWTTFTMNSAAAQKGTFTQESISADTNFIYYPSNDGIYIFNGTSEKDITGETINDVYSAIKNKSQIITELFDNRLFVFYADGDSVENNKCLVYHLITGAWESIDTDAYVSATAARNNPNGEFLQGSSRVGAIFKGENSDAGSSNIGGILRSELGTIFQGFGAPALLKRITKWRPEISEEGREYKVDCGFAKDFSTKVNYAFSVSVFSGDSISYEDYGWEDELPGTILSTLPYVYGEFRRAQLRYKHHAAFEPFGLESHTITAQAQRIR
ncbi:MAG: hypothetical protein ACK5MU_04000 [Candidatus Saccharimonadales bacterium]